MSPSARPAYGMGLPDAGRDDHRSLESVAEVIPLRDILLWPEELRPLSGRDQAQGSGTKGYVLHRGGLDRRGRHLAPGTGRVGRLKMERKNPWTYAQYLGGFGEF